MPRIAAYKAIALDPGLCEPYTSLGFYYAYFEWNFSESKKNFRKAIELNPAYATGRWWYAMLYLSWIEGNFKESQKEGWIAIKLEPFSAVARALQTVNYVIARDYEEAVAIGKTGIDLDPNTYTAHKMTAMAYIGMNRIQEAIEMIKETLVKSNRYQWSVFDLIWAYSHVPDHEAMKELIAEMDDRSKKEYISPFNRGLAAAWMGDLDQAFLYLEKSFEDREPMLLTIKTWPNVPDNMKADSRYWELIQRIGFPE